MHELLSEICRGAGALILEHYRPGLASREKTDAGWVTEADLRSEALILEALGRATPHARIVAEESGLRESGSELTWYVDPLDGTTNFARRVPFFAVSIAGAVGNELRYGAIYQPLSGELFYAERGRGAFLDEQPLQVGARSELRLGVIGTGDLYQRGELFEDAMAREKRVYARAMVVRTLGSVALSLAYVAAGRLDGFFFGKVNTWDVAAGLLLVEEAGGRCTSYDGDPALLLAGESLVAGNAEMVASLLQALSG